MSTIATHQTTPAHGLLGEMIDRVTAPTAAIREVVGEVFEVLEDAFLGPFVESLTTGAAARSQLDAHLLRDIGLRR